MRVGDANPSPRRMDRAATVLVARPCGRIHRKRHAPASSIDMKAKKKPTQTEEPMGIVISRGSRNEHVPTFSAYMWAPDPEGEEEKIEPKVA